MKNYDCEACPLKEICKVAEIVRSSDQSIKIAVLSCDYQDSLS